MTGNIRLDKPNLSECLCFMKKWAQRKHKALENTSWQHYLFAGEALYEGTVKGTVEAAFDSGRELQHDYEGIIMVNVAPLLGSPLAKMMPL